MNFQSLYFAECYIHYFVDPRLAQRRSIFGWWHLNSVSTLRHSEQNHMLNMRLRIFSWINLQNYTKAHHSYVLILQQMHGQIEYRHPCALPWRSSLGHVFIQYVTIIHLCLWIEYSIKISYPLSLSKVGNLPRISTMQWWSVEYTFCVSYFKDTCGDLHWTDTSTSVSSYLLSRAVCADTAGC